MGKRMAILGCNGYLGSEMAVFFSASQWQCDGFDLGEAMRPELSTYLKTYRKADVTDGGFWKTFDSSSYDAILFFAGLTGTKQGFEEPLKYLNANEAGLLNLLDRVKGLGPNAPKIIFPSTRLVYKGSDNLLSVDAPKETKTIYAVNKLACEHYLQAYHNCYGIPYAVVRLCIPYGSLLTGEYSYGTIGFFMKRAKAGQPITVYGDGSQKRTFSYITHIGTQIEDRLSESESGVYNISGGTYSIREAAEIIARKYGVEVKMVPWPEEDLKLESGGTAFEVSVDSVTDYSLEGNL